MALDLSLLERLTATPGVSGREDAVRALLRAELEPLVDEVATDPMGNLIAVRHGDGAGPRILLAAHMDEVGFLVRHVEDDGFVRIHPVGGIFPKYELAQRVRIHTEDGPIDGVLAEPTDLQMATEESKVPKLEECFVDPGASLEDIQAMVRPGDPVTVERALERFGDHIVSKALDDRIGAFIIVEVLRRLPRGAAEIAVIGSVQEEIGTRGVTVAAHAREKDVAVAVDTTMARDLPTVPPAKVVTRLGAGCSLKVMDRHQITPAPLLRFTRKLADERGIATQLEVGLPGGTDAEAIEISGDGAPAIALSIPCRYPHTASETVHIADVEATIDLVTAFCETVTVDDLRHASQPAQNTVKSTPHAGACDRISPGSSPGGSERSVASTTWNIPSASSRSFTSCQSAGCSDSTTELTEVKTSTGDPGYPSHRIHAAEPSSPPDEVTSGAPPVMPACGCPGDATKIGAIDAPPSPVSIAK